MNTIKPVAIITVSTMTVTNYDHYLKVLGTVSDPKTLDIKDHYLAGWFSAQPETEPTAEEIATEMRANGYHMCPDKVWRQTPSNGMFDGLCNHCEYASYEEEEPTEPLTVGPTLPEIVFDNQGWSQQLRGAFNVWFLIRRLGSGRYYIAEANGRTASAVLNFAGILALAATRVSGRVTPLNTGIVTDDDRRTNFGAF